MTTYSFQDVAATIVGPGGAFSLGYGEATAEEGITIVRAGDKNTMTIGSDGEGMHRAACMPTSLVRSRCAT